MNWGLRQYGITMAVIAGIFFVAYVMEPAISNINLSNYPLTGLPALVAWVIESSTHLFLFAGLVYAVVFAILNRNRFSGKDPVLDELRRIRRSRSKD
jgi:hypothetical protein